MGLNILSALTKRFMPRPEDVLKAAGAQVADAAKLAFVQQVTGSETSGTTDAGPVTRKYSGKEMIASAALGGLVIGIAAAVKNVFCARTGPPPAEQIEASTRRNRETSRDLGVGGRAIELLIADIAKLEGIIAERDRTILELNSAAESALAQAHAAQSRVGNYDSLVRDRITKVEALEKEIVGLKQQIAELRVEIDTRNGRNSPGGQ